MGKQIRYRPCRGCLLINGRVIGLHRLQMAGKPLPRSPWSRNDVRGRGFFFYPAIWNSLVIFGVGRP